MGREWKKNQKALQGNPVEFTVQMNESVSSLSGVVTPTTLTPARLRAPKAGKVDYVLVDVSPPVTSGVINAAVYNNGTVIASGVINAALPYMERMYHGGGGANAGLRPVIASGSFTHVEYSVSTKVGEDGQIGRTLRARVGLIFED
jgi:hypothetical protein